MSEMDYTPPLYVELKSVGNPDHGQKADEPMSPERSVCVDSIEEAQDAVHDYLAEFDLGSGNWAGGEVMDASGHVIGHISFNQYFMAAEGSKA